MNDVPGTIYLVHFERPFKHARHYLGFTEGTLTDRFERHMSNAAKRRGSALLRAVMLAAIGFKVVRVWQGTRGHERTMHNSGHAPRYCPVCKGIVTYQEATCLLQAETINEARDTETAAA